LKLTVVADARDISWIDVLANDDRRSEVDQRDASREQGKPFRSHLCDVSIFKITMTRATSEETVCLLISAVQFLLSIEPRV
jgi:hypothetical protein